MYGGGRLTCPTTAETLVGVSTNTLECTNVNSVFFIYLFIYLFVCYFWSSYSFLVFLFFYYYLYWSIARMFTNPGLARKTEKNRIKTKKQDYRKNCVECLQTEKKQKTEKKNRKNRKIQNKNKKTGLQKELCWVFTNTGDCKNYVECL